MSWQEEIGLEKPERQQNNNALTYLEVLDAIGEAEEQFHRDNLSNERVWFEEGDRLFAAATRLSARWKELRAKFSAPWPENFTPERKRIDDAIAETQHEIRTYLKPYQLLLAFAFENYLKGFIIGRRRILEQGEVARPDGRLANDLKEHNLLKLLDLTDQAEKFDDDEKLILQVLSRVAIWEGRYPFALAPRDQKSKMTSGERAIAGGSAALSLFAADKVDDLDRKLRKLINETLANDCLEAAVSSLRGEQPE
ncbi:MAG: hypothetical protein U0931_15000 [Vulcanimicrobiota bacterium]